MENMRRPTDAAAAASPESVEAALPPIPSLQPWRTLLRRWLSDLPASVKLLVALALVNTSFCMAFSGLLLQAERQLDNATLGEGLIAPLGGAALAVSVWAFGLLLWGLWIEEVCVLSACLSVSTFASVLPLLLVPWDRIGTSDASAACLGLALAVIALQVPSECPQHARTRAPTCTRTTYTCASATARTACLLRGLISRRARHMPACLLTRLLTC